MVAKRLIDSEGAIGHYYTCATSAVSYHPPFGRTVVGAEFGIPPQKGQVVVVDRKVCLYKSKYRSMLGDGICSADNEKIQ